MPSAASGGAAQAIGWNKPPDQLELLSKMGYCRHAGAERRLFRQLKRELP